MNTNDMHTLYGYHSWANQRVLAAAAQLSPQSWNAQLGYAQLRNTLVHLVSTEWIWRSRWHEHVSPTAHLDPDDFPTLGVVQARWAEEQAKMQTFLATLSDDALNSTFSYKVMSGKPYTTTLWHAMQQLVLHGMQHRAELAMLLTELDSSPGDIDFILYVREQGL